MNRLEPKSNWILREHHHEFNFIGPTLVLLAYDNKTFPNNPSDQLILEENTLTEDDLN